jgi:hypothetical protein
VPRRRPPLTAREIGAYRCGWRLFAYWDVEHRRGEPTEDWMLQLMSGLDAEIFASMTPSAWWEWFNKGWDDRHYNRGQR